MREKGANSDRVIAAIAGRQNGAISRAQLLATGIDKSAISRRLRAGRLHRLYRGVYAVGHTRLTFEGRCMAALLALGDGAVISHRSAAAVWGMLKPTDGPIHITLPGDGGRKRRRGIAIHRSHSLIVGDTTRRRNLRVTKPKRTLRDLHRTSPEPVYRRAARRALDLGLIGSADLKSEDELTRSELERLFVRLCRRTAFLSQR